MPKPYVEYGPRETSPPPYKSNVGRHLGLLLLGESNKIQELCDNVLNKPAEALGSPFRYRPLTEIVLLFVGAWEDMFSVPYKGRGTANEHQASLWVTAERGTEEGGQVHWEPEQSRLMVPYMFVDNPMSLLNGREVYGYQKSLGRFEPPWTGASARVLAFGGNFANNNSAEWRPVLELYPVGAAPQPGPPAQPLEVVQQLVALVNAELAAGKPADPAVALAFTGALLAGTVQQVFLKQYREVDGNLETCYQHIVEAPVTFGNPKVHAPGGAWWVTIPNPSSHPITDDLGVKSGPAIAAFELEATLTLQTGVVVA
jgi:hypothetical protein